MDLQKTKHKHWKDLDSWGWKGPPNRQTLWQVNVDEWDTYCLYMWA